MLQPVPNENHEPPFMINPQAFPPALCMMGTIVFNQFVEQLEENDMWTKPAVTEMRFGFEVTMYVCNR
jgi:pyrroloquinoline quinone biosynthesis protein A